MTPGPRHDHVITSEKGTYVLKFYKDPNSAAYLYKLENKKYNLLHTIDDYFYGENFYISDEHEIIIEIGIDGTIAIFDLKMELLKAIPIYEIYGIENIMKYGELPETLRDAEQKVFYKNEFIIEPNNTKDNANSKRGRVIVNCSDLSYRIENINYEIKKDNKLISYQISIIILGLTSIILGIVLYKKRKSITRNWS